MNRFVVPAPCGRLQKPINSRLQQCPTRGQGYDFLHTHAKNAINELLVLDDKKARRIAHQIGIEIIGTVGVLLRAKTKGIISTIKPILDELNAVDFRISPALYQQALRLAQET